MVKFLDDTAVVLLAMVFSSLEEAEAAEETLREIVKMTGISDMKNPMHPDQKYIITMHIPFGDYKMITPFIKKKIKGIVKMKKNVA